MKQGKRVFNYPSGDVATHKTNEQVDCSSYFNLDSTFAIACLTNPEVQREHSRLT